MTNVPVTQILTFGLGWIENIAGKEENAGYQHFFPFPTMFSTGVFLWVVKTRDCLVKDEVITFSMSL